MRKIESHVKRRIGRSRGLKMLPLCLCALIFLPTVAFASRNYGTYRSTQNPNYSFQYLDTTNQGKIDPVKCLAYSSNGISKCLVQGERDPHYYWNGRIIDNELDAVAEQICLSNQAAQAEQVKSQQKSALPILWIGILFLMGIVGFICLAFGTVVVFSSILDLVLSIGFLVLGGIIVAVWAFCSENGHLYGINFSSHDFQIFLLIWLSLWFVGNAIQAFRHNNVFLALFALASRITTPIFILIICNWITSAIDRYLNHGCKK